MLQCHLVDGNFDQFELGSLESRRGEFEARVESLIGATATNQEPEKNQAKPKKTKEKPKNPRVPSRD